MSIAELIYQHSLNLPEHAAKQALAFIQFLEQQPQIVVNKELGKKRQAGSAVGKLIILQEDDQHLDDFKDYM